MKSHETLSSRLYRGACIFVLFFVAASISFNGFYQKWHFHDEDLPGDNSDASLDRMLDGTAHRPYIYRQLIPAIANGMDRITPQTTKAWLYTHQGTGADAYIYAISSSAIANNPVYFYRYLVTYVITFLFTLLAIYAMYWLCEEIGLPPPAALFASVIFILLLPYFMSIGGFYYDSSELAFFALAALLALKFDWWWLVPVAVLGEWNKESFLLIVLTLYPLLRRRSSRTSALAGTGVLFMVCLAVYYPIRLHFTHNPGGTVEVQWRDQLHYFLHPLATLFDTEETYGVRMLRVFTVIPMALIVWTVVRGWKHLPTEVKRHGQIAAAINIPLFLLFCTPGEFRDLGMLYLVLLLTLASNLNQWIAGTKTY